MDRVAKEAVAGVPNYEPRIQPKRTRKNNRSKAAAAAAAIGNSAPVALSLNGKRTRRNTKPREFTLADSTKYISELKGAPMYLVNGHACLCPLAGGCYVPGSSALFTIPIDAYIQSFVIPEEFFCMTDPEKRIVLEKDDIRRMLYIHSASDIEYAENVGESKLSFLGQMKRATGGVFDGERLVYPNVAFTFNQYEDEEDDTKPHTLVPRKGNRYGVYRLDTLDPDFDGAALNNTMSIIAQDSSREGETWFLEDIIREVKAKEGVRRAIFVLTGCFNLCKPPPAKDVDALQTIVERAHNAFNTLKPTVEITEARAGLKNGELAIPYNIGSYGISGAMTIREVLRMRNLTDPEVYLKELAFMLHPEDQEKLREVLEKERKARPAKKAGKK